LLLELAVVPLARGPSLSADVAELVRIIDSGGLDYRLTPAVTVIEGDWDQLVDVAKRAATWKCASEQSGSSHS
jgi:uncharacterized protein YqgV (UPF0045/DUF77 family)